MSDEDRHVCQGYLPVGGYGAAVTCCVEDEEGKLWVANGEYESQVNYCPYCGFRASTQVTDE